MQLAQGVENNQATDQNQLQQFDICLISLVISLIRLLSNKSEGFNLSPDKQFSADLV